jgi:hypothetical protein
VVTTACIVGLSPVMSNLFVMHDSSRFASRRPAAGQHSGAVGEE